MLFGYDNFNDKRFANNHQSGSDYRILGTTSIVRGADIYPRWLPGSTTIQWNPIAEGSQGTNFRTNALFFNDNWRWTDRVTVNLGLRWDKNQGKDSAGAGRGRRQRVQPARRRRVGSDGQGPVGGDGQLREICRGAEQLDRRLVVRRRQPGNDPVHATRGRRSIRT